MKELMHGIRRFLQDEEGATAVEYGLMVALIAAIIIAAVTGLGLNVKAAFEAVCGAIGKNACTAAPG